jgi:hypothetical protein
LHSQISQAKREAQAYLEQRESARIGDKIIARREKQKLKADRDAAAAPVAEEKRTESAPKPMRRDERKQLDDGFLAQFLGGGPKSGTKRARDE